jgi:hypothetical protein
VARYVNLYELFPPNVVRELPHSRPRVYVNADAVEYLVASESRRHCTDLHMVSGSVVTVQGAVGGNAWCLREGPLSRRWGQSRISARVRRFRDQIEIRRLRRNPKDLPEELAG